ncbi:MAG: fructose-bisphosphatase class III [Erysipelotrichia bacterium]|nr:fructose-bisphosphatase class III [Erysipelotrichia bacterium]
MSIYVMSDLHGLSNRFFTMLKLIDFQQSDHLYILGDVIDRGDDGIMLLQYIMQQENMTLLMGNHELMMLEYYETLQQGIPNVSVMTRWYRNGCEKTIQAFEKLTRKERKAMLAYLRSLPLAIADVKVRDKMYYLVHGAAILSLKTGKAYLDSDMMKLFTPADFVWNRVGKEQHFFDDRVVIFGHTMSIFYYLHTYYFNIGILKIMKKRDGNPSLIKLF